MIEDGGGGGSNRNLDGLRDRRENAARKAEEDGGPKLTFVDSADDYFKRKYDKSDGYVFEICRKWTRFAERVFLNLLCMAIFFCRSSNNGVDENDGDVGYISSRFANR